MLTQLSSLVRMVILNRSQDCRNLSDRCADDSEFRAHPCQNQVEDFHHPEICQDLDRGFII